MSLSGPYTPPQVVAVFLAKFDMRLGYQLVWSRGEVALDGIEYKALLSGVHERSAATIYLTHESRGTLHYGMARFRRLNLNAPGGTDRQLVRMYSLGVLTQPPAVQWKPNEYASGGWEYLGAVDAAVRAYAADENQVHLEQLWGAIGTQRAAAPDLLQVPGGGGHPLLKTAAVLAAVGPLIFPIYKAALLRQLVLIFTHPGGGEAEAGEAEADEANEAEAGVAGHAAAAAQIPGAEEAGAQGAEHIPLQPQVQPPHAEGTDPFALSGALAYLVALISVVPQDVRFEPRDDIHLLSSQPLYTVGLHDIDSGVFAHHPGFVASTSDDILKHQRHLYDVAVHMPGAPAQECRVYAGAPAHPVRATFNDYGKFRRVYRRLPDSDDHNDAASVHTASLLFSALRYGGDPPGAWEPAWWLRRATLPMSWREYIWLALAWFASAGTTDRRAGGDSARAPADDTAGDDDAGARSPRLLVVRLTHVVGYFHKLTKKWFYLVEEIVAEALEERAPGAGKITLQLTHQDMTDMELDPYAHQDLTFVRQFVLLYWGLVVDEVEIGLGLQRVLC